MKEKVRLPYNGIPAKATATSTASAIPIKAYHPNQGTPSQSRCTCLASYCVRNKQDGSCTSSKGNKRYILKLLLRLPYLRHFTAKLHSMLRRSVNGQRSKREMKRCNLLIPHGRRGIICPSPRNFLYRKLLVGGAA